MTVYIYHSFDPWIETRYAHLSSIYVNTSQMVKAGDSIGEVGKTGNVPDTADAHLHFEVIVEGAQVDPELYFHWS